MRPEPDYYGILQVNPHAEPEVIQAAYRRLSAKYHPDRDPSPQASERMKLLNAAYEVLSNPEKRAAYDRSHDGLRQPEAPGTEAKPRRRPWWLLPVALVFIFLGLRFNPRLALILGIVFLVLWLLWRRRASKPS